MKEKILSLLLLFLLLFCHLAYNNYKTGKNDAKNIRYQQYNKV